MAKKTFLVNIDLNYNELRNARLHNLNAAPSLGTGDAGYTYWDTEKNSAFFWTGTAWVGLASDTIVQQDITVALKPGVNIGKYINGAIIPCKDKTLEWLIRDLAIDYIDPTLSLTVQGQTTPLEFGTVLTGTKVFNWTYDNHSGSLGKVVIRDTTANTDLGDQGGYTLTTGSQALTITDKTLLPNGSTQVWTASSVDATPTIPKTIYSAVTVQGAYKMFYGNASEFITPGGSSVENRTYADTLEFHDNWVANTFTFEVSPGENKKIVIMVPATKTISVINEDAFGSSVTFSTAIDVDVRCAGTTDISYHYYQLSLEGGYTSAQTYIVTLT